MELQKRIQKKQGMTEYIVPAAVFAKFGGVYPSQVSAASHELGGKSAKDSIQFAHNMAGHAARIGWLDV